MKSAEVRIPFANRWQAMLSAGVLALALQHAPASATERSAEAELRATLDRHLAAINARDLDALLATVTDDEVLTTILPNGEVLETRQQYRQLHADWFAERDWRMAFDVQALRVIGDAGIARVRYDSQVRDEAGAYASKRRAILTLLFAREEGAWRLVHDQNTVIPERHD